MSHVDFISNSNKRAQEKKRVCKNHVFSIWGEGFARCVQGNKFNQPCEELKEENNE